jgi:hypothetical protein
MLSKIGAIRQYFLLQFSKKRVRPCFAKSGHFCVIRYENIIDRNGYQKPRLDEYLNMYQREYFTTICRLRITKLEDLSSR